MCYVAAIMDVGSSSKLVIAASRDQTQATYGEIDDIDYHLRETHRTIEQSRILLRVVKAPFIQWNGTGAGDANEKPAYPACDNSGGEPC
ncbi:hypothetical protein [Mesorhizobium sp. B1-1-8]|uniref:hypothetical protein n=1 Tax=Mesorhizobium sp. B1-1-8 TaxID=2589976 RepID=UPI00112E28DB|nr:hypothetical protein [Mesorhizobium sp. B1-1-8]UCI10692.1 hypothetical protein FJ974_28390 [Mesorhizobium sp. B1-1-8]